MEINKTALLEIFCSGGEQVFVYPGRLSELDILVKYKHNGSRERTPKHIHWVADLLLKKQCAPTLTNALLDYFLDIWTKCTPISCENERENLALEFINYPEEFNRLDKYGYYSTAFLVVIAELLARQEKTNYPKAYMFSRVLTALRTSDDLYSIISTASWGGRRF